MHAPTSAQRQQRPVIEGTAQFTLRTVRRSTMPLEEPSTPPDRAELDQLLGEIRALRTLACPLLTAHVAAIIRQALPQAAWASFHTERGEANNYYVYTKYPYLYDATGKEIMYGFTQS